MAGSSSDDAREIERKARERDVNAIIDKVYYDTDVIGSIKRTLADARKEDPDLKITEAEVKKWKDQNVQRKINLRGYNSWIANKPREEYQMDLFEMPVVRYKDARKMTAAEKAEHKKKLDEQRNVERRVKRPVGEGMEARRGVKPKYIVVEKIPKSAAKRYGLLLVDIFTKYVDVIPMVNNKGTTIIEALKTSMRNMGGEPKTIYSDAEGGLQTKAMRSYLEETNIRLVQTRLHAAYAERHIRTIKDMLFKRLEYNKGHVKNWHTLLPNVLKEYNNQMIHSSHKFTPTQAKESRNEAVVKGRLEAGRISNRRCPK